MDIKECAEYVGKKFVYRRDVTGNFFDSWSVLTEKEDGNFYGDCEDFSMTTFWIHSNENLFVFLFRLLISHEYGLHFSITRNGEKHAVGSYKGLWFDNWTRCALPKDEFLARTGHKLKFRFFNVIMILPMIVGLFLRSKK